VALRFGEGSGRLIVATRSQMLASTQYGVMSTGSQPEVDEGALVVSGRAEDFGVLYGRYEDSMLAFFLRRTGNAELAADLTAETFAAALAGRASFDPGRGSAAGWLFGIARHLLARSVERGRVEDKARRRLGMERIVLPDDALERVLELVDQPALRALDGLRADQRAAVGGRVLGERDYGALARELRCSESVVRQRVSRGLRALRERLEEPS
jgi:RNA polymerase sigma factor (sigma-70 family)